MLKGLKILLLAGVSAGLFGCASTGRMDSQHRAETSGISDTARFYGEEISAEEEKELLTKNTLYFGYDRFDITYENNLVILAHAKRLLEEPNLRLRVEGHTDERGSREYNAGLGERRAKSITQILAMKGVPEDRFVTVSYGKEKPISLGHNEKAWRLNRRAEVYYEVTN